MGMEWNLPQSTAFSTVAIPGLPCGVRHTLFLPVAQDSGFSAFTVLLLLAVDVVVYAALAWYCDKVGWRTCWRVWTGVCGGHTQAITYCCVGGNSVMCDLQIRDAYDARALGTCRGRPQGILSLCALAYLRTALMHLYGCVQ
jgi:hypothetical protein